MKRSAVSASVQINNVVQAITRVTCEAADGSNQIALTVSDLNRLTEDLQVIVKQFKFNDNGLKEGPQSGSGNHFSKNQLAKPQLRFAHTSPIRKEAA